MSELTSLLEAYLFAAAEPIKAADAAKALTGDPGEVDQALRSLADEYEVRGGGLRIIQIAGGYQMATWTEHAADLGRLLAAPGGRPRLSKPALETLAVIAYQQPVTQAEMEAVRGVSVDGVVKTLTERGLIQEAGRKQTPGRPILYATTDDFLHHFGLNEISDLPALDRIQTEENEVDKETHDALGAVGLEERLDD